VVRRLLALGLGLVPACVGPAPFPPRDAATDVLRADAPRPDAPWIRPDAPTLPPADVEVTLPFGAKATRLDVEVEAGLARLDLVVSMDGTGSFGGEVGALQRSLESVVLPELEDRATEVAVGIARFQDFPVSPFGGPTDLPFELITAVTTDRGRIRAALDALGTIGSGGDLPESGAEALYQIATGEGFVLDGRTLVPPFGGPASGGGSLGGAGFREGSYRIVVHVTDAPTHEWNDYGALVPGAHGSAQAISMLNALEIRTLGIASSEAAREHLETIALGTEATMRPTEGRCATGVRGAPRPPRAGTCPLVFDVGPDGEGLSGAITDAIVGLLDALFWAEAHGEVTEDRYGFVQAIEAEGASPEEGSPAPGREDRIGGDGVLDTFVDVATGTRLRFSVLLRNETLAPADYDQVFRIGLRIVGDGTVLDELTVRVLVPRSSHDAGASEATDAGVEPAEVGPSDAGGDASG
jgi:hypothetical protein